MVRVCTPAELPALLPSALAGGEALLPVLRPDDAVALRPGLPTLPGTAVIVTTSGSTGQPKGVELSAEAMLASARATRSALGVPMRWYSALPLQYVAGLMTLVRGEESGLGSALVASDLSDLPPADLVEPRGLSIVPTQLHRAVEDEAVVQRLAGFDAVLLGGAPASTELVDRARTLGIRVVRTYGMSETSGGCVYEGRPLPGVDLATDPGSGRLRIHGPMLFSGYRLNPEATEEALQDGWLLTNDRGRLETDEEGRRLEVLGRVDDVVISGGVNVDLARVQRVVDELGVVAAVVGVPDAEWGTRIVLAVETGTDEALVDRDVTALEPWRRRLAERGLQTPALPRQVVALIRLPRTDSGKIDRRAVAQQVT